MSQLLKSDPALMAEWKAAKRVERAPSRKDKEQSAPPAGMPGGSTDAGTPPSDT